MSYQLDGDWRVWNARLVADASILKELRRAGMPSSSIAADTLGAMGHLAAEWHKAVMEFDKTCREQLEPTAVEHSWESSVISTTSACSCSCCPMRWILTGTTEHAGRSRVPRRPRAVIVSCSSQLSCALGGYGGGSPGGDRVIDLYLLGAVPLSGGFGSCSGLITLLS